MRPPQHSVEAVSVAQMRQIDETAIHTYGIPRLLLMDRAGQAIARIVLQQGLSPTTPILLCCGSGYNGGDGLCAAWHLAQAGCQPRVILLGSRQRLKEEPAVYARILRALGIPLKELEDLRDVDVLCAWFDEAGLIVDALLGIGLEGPVRPLSAACIRAINQARKPVVAVDIPSGLNGDTGEVQGEAVNASITVTFGLPKQGCLRGEGPAHTGDLIVDAIGIPAPLRAGRQ